MRALAALCVVSFHVWLYNLSGPIARPDLLDKVMFEARVGLVFFFVLSGYLVYRPFARAALGRSAPVALNGYFVRRAARIIPAYYVAIVGAFVLMSTVGDVPGRRQVDIEYLPIFFLFLQNYFPVTVLNLDGPTWTLVVEVGFYLLLPVLALTVWRRWGSVKGQLAALAALGIVGLTWNLISHFQGWSTIASHSLFPFLPYFALGMSVALAATSGRPRAGRAASIALALAGVALILVNGYWHATDRSLGLTIETFRDLPAAVGMAAIVAATAIGTGAGMSWLASRPLVWIGAVSYGLYLWHVPLIVWLNGHDLLPGGLLVRYVIIVPIALGVGAASWYLIERRFVSRSARWPRTVDQTP